MVACGFSMADAGTGLSRRRGKCAGKSRGINEIRPELVFRDVPGSLVQWGGHAQGFRRGWCLRHAAINPPGDGVARVPAAPTGLGFLPPRRLAFRIPAGMLAATYSPVWAEPPAANRTRSLPGLWHGDASGHHALVRETGSGQNAWVSFGKQGWVNSRERRSPVPEVFLRLPPRRPRHCG